MNTSKNTVLITGGASGIGLAMAKAFLEAGNEVAICGRREEKLQQAKETLPGLDTLACDISRREDRERLFEWMTTRRPETNILINNAGIQRETSFPEGASELTDGESEIETNLTASVHLAALFTRSFLQQDRECAIINVTSGLAFIPLKIVPVYCATKAALHSFSMSLRSQLVETNVRVFEIIPPLVQTELHRGAQAKKQAEQGIQPERVAEATLRGMKRDRYEVAVGRGKDLMVAARLAPHFFHGLLNKAVAS